MGAQKGPYNAEFPVGTYVRVKPRDFLEEFQRTWKLHDPLENFQRDFAGRTAKVASVSYYFGADELYTLEGIPGIWNEPCLETASTSDCD
jgi:hypothetical protein